MPSAGGWFRYWSPPNTKLPAQPVRQAERAHLRASGVEPIIVDVFDASAISRAIAAVQPDIVVHQLTDLPRGLDPSEMIEGTQRNARMRREGDSKPRVCRAQIRRASACHQSIAWMYAPGPEPHSETDPLALQASGARATTVAGVAALEHLTVSSPPIEGVVLRYGHLYGPNTGTDVAGEPPSLHVDAAAKACLLAIEKAHFGIYNIAEPSGYVSTEKAQRELGFEPAFRLDPQ
ncbi:dTDP-glucose 4,6-dehydratase [Bradyrhizobium sp. STM 3557]|uniref:dTDP-glucose 4,6-dehydratase n=1 Tax=Bradyrhizobium sp. STM 3557 TaxID=578920 RepID=UPI00388DDDDD